MNKSKQATLFQSWGKTKKEPETRADNPALASSSHSICLQSYSTDPEIIDLCKAVEEDEDDEFLLEALDDVSAGQNGSSSYSNIDPAKCSTIGNKQKDNSGDISHISIGADLLPTQSAYTQDNNLPGFDRAAGKLWIYPTNYPVREYQFNIVQQALFKNTLVVLPTGLGKTFIASVLMYNLYRWYPQGKVIFMAPTKPLVAQQIEACYKIMGIPQKDTAEMTGNMGPTKREKAWCENRVFFLTPQVMANDLSRGSCPAEKVKCLVVDEAHKALGNHAYCQVVRELIKYTQDFRVLALSATPGSDIKTVQQVINNLLISQIELRTEDSPDIRQYSHERKVEKIVIPLGDELSSVKATYIKILEVFVSRLKQQGVLYNRDTTSLSKFLILKAREAFRQNPPERLQRQHYGAVEGDFALAMSLYHGYELLQLHGARSLYTFLDGIVNGEKGYGRTRAELMRNSDFNDLLEMLTQKFTPAPSQRSSISSSANKEKKPFVTGHPKMEKLQEIVLDHFQNYANDENLKKGVATRIMIFSQYRDSVKEITDMLNQHYPQVKVMSFIGQSSAGKSTKGFTQKEQLKVMKKFREGGYNTLVSTCVGEEGLDIGEVDLIICFDAHKSPIRLVQRMGRTGRKRDGRIVMLVTQGKEEQIYNQSQYSKRSIHKAILNGAKSLHFYQFSPCIVPDNTAPICHKMHISIKEQFIPTRKMSADKDQCTNSAIGMKSLSSSEEILTREEYEELVSEWGLPLDQVPKMPKSSDIICLSAEPQEEMVEKENDNCRVLSLTEWLPWQNQLQPTHLIEHSLASKHLVELMEFIEIQQTLNPEDDNYGLEMATYLNEDDILKPVQTKSYTDGIKQFCVPLSENTEIDTRQYRRKRRNSEYITDFNEHYEVNSELVCNIKTKKRKTDLPDIEIQHVEILPDDVELPPFDLNDKNPVDKGMIKSHSGVLNENQMFEVSKERQFNLKPSEKCLNSDVLLNQKCPSKKMNLNNKETLPYDRRKTESDLLRKNRKRVKINHPKIRQSVVEVIADMDDDDDFDISEKNENSDQLMPINSPGNECERIDELSNKNFDVEDENIKNMFKLFPVIRGVRHSNNKLHGDMDIDKAGSLNTVRSPPSVVDMVEILDAPDIEHHMICLDITQIAEEWEKENQINNTGEINSVLDLEKCEYSFEKFKKGPTELPSVSQKQFDSSKNIHAQLDSFKNKSENSNARKTSKSLLNDLTTYAGMKEELKNKSENFEQGPTDVLKNEIYDFKSCTMHSEESISLHDAVLINKDDNKTIFTPSDNPRMNQDGGSPKIIKQGGFGLCKIGAKTSVNSKQQLLSMDDVRSQKALVLNKHAPTDKCLLLNPDTMDKGVRDILESHQSSDDSEIDDLLFSCLEKSKKRVRSSCAKNHTSLGKSSQVVSSLNRRHDSRNDSRNDSTNKLSDVIGIIPFNQKTNSCSEMEIIGGSLKRFTSGICSKFDKSVCDFPDDSRSRQNQTLNIAQADTSSFVLDKDLHMQGYSPSPYSRSKLNSRNNAKDINCQQTCSEDSNTKMQTKLLLPIFDSQVIEHDKVYLEKDRSRIDSLQFERNNSFNEIFEDDADFDVLEAVETSCAKKDTSTQFTFTQALDCVNDSLVLSTEPMDKCSRDRPRKGITASVSKQKAIDANFNYQDRSDSRDVSLKAAQFMHMSEKDQESLPSNESQTSKENANYQNQSHDTYMAKNTSSTGTTTSDLTNSDEDLIGFPEFDLGFDLDEDIVPPSPCSTQFSQSSLSNQKSFYSRRSLKLSSKEESFSENSCIVSSDCQIQIVQDKISNLKDKGENKKDDGFFVTKRKNNNNQTGKGDLETIEEDFDSENERNMKNTGDKDKLRRKSFNYIEISKSSDAEERQNRNGFYSDEKLKRMDQDMQDEQKMTRYNSEDLTLHDTSSVAKENVAICSFAGSDKTDTNLTNKLAKMGKGLWVGHELASNKQRLAENNMQTMAKPFPIEDKSNCSSQEEEVLFETSFSLQFEDDFLSDLVETEDQDIVKSIGQEKPLTQSSQSSNFLNCVGAPDSYVENRNGEEPDKGVESDPDMHVGNDSHMDDSFVLVGKKRKMAILSSPETPDYSSKIRKTNNENLDCKFKTPLRPLTLSIPRRQYSIINTDSKNRKNSKACLSFDLTNVQRKDEDEDFENPSLWFSKRAQNEVIEEPKRLTKISVKIKSDIEKVVNTCISTKDKKKKQKRSFKSNPFIEHEAEVNEEDLWHISEDEADHSDLDNLDESFINDATQMSQVQAVDDSDMHAVYLKSIRSPIRHTESGRFKLKKHYHRKNVFSQVPEEDESQYMEDSFCVADDDVEELSLISEDDEESEIKIRKEISLPRRKQTGKSKMENFKAKLKARNKTNRRRIRIFSDSSSSDEELDEKEEDINSSNKEFSRTFEIKEVLSLSSIDDEDDVCDNAKLNSSTKKCISKNKTYVHDGCRESVIAKNIDPVVKDNHCKTTEELRQERLKRQKEKQEEFRRKTMEKAGLQNIKIGCDTKDKEQGQMEEVMTKLKSRNTCMSVEIVTKQHENEQNIIIPELNEEESSIDMMADINANTSKPAKKFVLLVDSREISGAQDIVSTLRFQHNIHVCAAQLPGCDYIVSNRMAVDRKQWSEFSNGSNRVKLIERMQYFVELYDQPCLILESDRIKLGDDKSHRPIHWTKYVDKMLSQLIRSNIRLYFTNNQIETAALLAELCQLEHRKNKGISVPPELNSQQQSVAKFLCTVPKLGYIHVLNLCNGFRTLSDLIDSSITSIEKKGQISQSRAMEVYRYIRRIFNSNMLPGN